MSSYELFWMFRCLLLVACHAFSEPFHFPFLSTVFSIQLGCYLMFRMPLMGLAILYSVDCVTMHTTCPVCPHNQSLLTPKHQNQSSQLSQSLSHTTTQQLAVLSQRLGCQADALHYALAECTSSLLWISSVWFRVSSQAELRWAHCIAIGDMHSCSVTFPWNLFA